MKSRWTAWSFHDILLNMERKWHIQEIERAFTVHPVLALLGPRQCGKSTLARHYSESLKLAKKFVHHFDLEDPADETLLSNPKTNLESLEGLIIIDEVQRNKTLFPVLRVLVDEDRRRGSNRKFLLLGSASQELIQSGSESLAGRIQFHELTPFSLTETGVEELKKLWIRGGFPLSFLAPSSEISSAWRKAYVSTFLERDIPLLGFQIPPAQIRKFWMMITHYHGQTWNASEIASSLGISDTTSKKYLDILTGTFMIRSLQPWFENIGKRQLKKPKIYFRDSGLYHTLLGVNDKLALDHHPKKGASWEGFALEQVTQWLQASDAETYYWGIHGQSELDLLIVRDGKKMGFEFKYQDAPQMTTSMINSLEQLKLDSLTVVYPGEREYQLEKGVRVVGLQGLVGGRAKN